MHETGFHYHKDKGLVHTSDDAKLSLSNRLARWFKFQVGKQVVRLSATAAILIRP